MATFFYFLFNHFLNTFLIKKLTNKNVNDPHGNNKKKSKQRCHDDILKTIKMGEKLVIIPRIKKLLQQENSETPTNSELIQPKKLINPCKVSVARQELHRELLFNQKIGTSPLNKKTELQKALEKLKSKETVVPMETFTDFEKILSERKRLIDDEIEEKEEKIEEQEFLKVHRKISSKK